MNPALANAPDALRLNLTLPASQMKIGPVSVDPIQLLFGASLSEVLSSLMVGPKSQRTTPEGATLDVYPLAIPEGQGAAVPVRFQGEVGFRNYRGMFVLIVPASMSEVVRGQLAGEIAAKTAAGPRLSQGTSGPIAEYAIRLMPGMRKAVPLGAVGELGIEAA